MFLDTETKVPVLREVLSPQLVFLHLQASLKDLLSLNNTGIRWEQKRIYFTVTRIIDL